ncbi:MAG TPA: hypothetical protein EYH03_00320 [Chromatiales bacterium]|nr:hypothetical protein [Chromatiales bacterium]
MIEEYTVEQAKQGNNDAARLLLQFAIDAFSKNSPLAPEIAQYFAESFGRILKGEEPAKALNLPSAKEENQFDHETDHLEIVIDYWKLRESGEKSKVARRLVAESWGIPEARVKKIVREFKNAVHEVMDLRQRMRTISLQAAENTDLKTFLDRLSVKA